MAFAALGYDVQSTEGRSAAGAIRSVQKSKDKT